MRRFLREFSRKPVTLLRAAMPRRWSERTVIALVMQWLDNSITVKPVRSRNRWKLTSVQGHGEPNPTWIPQGHKAIRAMARELTTLGGAETIAGGTWNELADIPMTAHFLGGAVISDSPEHGVIDPYHRVFGYPNLFVVDGSAISANLGVNPALTITAQAERAFAMWPVKGQADQRPAAGMAYRKVSAPQANMPGGA